MYNIIYSRKILLSGVLVDPHVGFWRLLQIPSTDLKDVIGLAEAQLILGERGWIQSLYEYPVVWVQNVNDMLLILFANRRIQSLYLILNLYK